MSAADDMSLMAMQAANMSLASIAQTMGWDLTRTTRRLSDLASDRGEAVALVRSGAPTKRGLEPLAEKPIADGQAMVLRVFLVRQAIHGADCLLGDGRRIYTVTGRERVDEKGQPNPVRPGARIRVRQVPVAEAFPSDRPTEDKSLAAYLQTLADIGWTSDGSCWVMGEGAGR